MQHNNTNIWIKYCLLKIYLNYRELMTTSCWQQRNDSSSKRKLQEKFLNSQNIFCNSLIFFSLAANSYNTLGTPCRALLYEEGWSSFYRWGFGLQMNLQSWKFWISSHVGQVEHSVEERVREEREEIFFSFLRLHVACQVSW